jgi:hypothetical protein
MSSVPRPRLARRRLAYKLQNEGMRQRRDQKYVAMPWLSACADEPVVKSWRPQAVATLPPNANKTSIVPRGSAGLDKRAPSPDNAPQGQVTTIVPSDVPFVAPVRVVANVTNVTVTVRAIKRAPAVPSRPRSSGSHGVRSHGVGSYSSFGLVSATFFAGALFTLLLLAPTVLLQVYVAIPIVVLSGAVVVYFGSQGHGDADRAMQQRFKPPAPRSVRAGAKLNGTW